MTDKPRREMTIAGATKRVVAIRLGTPAELAKARQKVLDDAAAREAKALDSVPEEARSIVRAKADKECPAERGGVSFQEAIGRVAASLPTEEESPPPDPAVDEVPERLREPLTEARKAVARGGR